MTVYYLQGRYTTAYTIQFLASTDCKRPLSEVLLAEDLRVTAGVGNPTLSIRHPPIAEIARHLLVSWILVPFSTVAMLYFVLALNTVISLGTVQLPASVACLLILFVLIFLDLILSKENMDRVLKVLDWYKRQRGRCFDRRDRTNVAQKVATRKSKRIVYSSRDQGQAIAQTDLEENRRPGQHKRQIIGRVDEIDQKSARSTPPTTVGSPHTTIQSSNTLNHTLNWADIILKNVDISIYLFFFISIGIPTYYTTTYTMPIFLTLNILLNHLSTSIPPNLKRVTHPVLLTSLLTILLIWILALTKHQILREGLTLYKANTTYLSYFRGTPSLPLPGAGDILSSLLDASIVSLAMPMYQYRHDLYQHFIAIFVPVSALAVVSLFGYPPLCYRLGVSKSISLAMAPRSVALALAQLSAVNLGERWGLLVRLLFYGDVVAEGPEGGGVECVGDECFGILFVVLTVIPPVGGMFRVWLGCEN
ncbi:hypothetical protein BDZ45DRAFT_807227 [Acephala macrosclerotiorum]|nr:hypothetical protein BDZ45DRAFT_807227 [Acephala macrosclerotiorum]